MLAQCPEFVGSCGGNTAMTSGVVLKSRPSARCSPPSLVQIPLVPPLISMMKRIRPSGVGKKQRCRRAQDQRDDRDSTSRINRSDGT